jgi:serine/threonine protein kinase
VCAHCPELLEDLVALLPTLEAVVDLERSLGGAEMIATSDTHRLRGVLGDFQIIREIGRGGMGIVYETEQISLGRKMALKVLPFAATLDKQRLKRFQNEARAAATLDHPSIVAVHSVGEERGVHYYAMQLVEGQSLAEVIAAIRESRDKSQETRAGGMRSAECGVRNEESVVSSQLSVANGGPATNHEQLTTEQSQSEIRNLKSEIETQAIAALSTEYFTNPKRFFRRVAEIGAQIAEALGNAHQQGVTHRDVKSANILLDVAGKALVTDFGLARLETDHSLTTTGNILGTLRYMSPEQALGKGMVDHRTDIYSLGATLYEFLTLMPLFVGNDRQDVLRKIAFDEPRPARPPSDNRAFARPLFASASCDSSSKLVIPTRNSVTCRGHSTSLSRPFSKFPRERTSNGRSPPPSIMPASTTRRRRRWRSPAN